MACTRFELGCFPLKFTLRDLMLRTLKTSLKKTFQIRNQNMNVSQDGELTIVCYVNKVYASFLTCMG